jgi:hypothetical protein
MPLYNNAATEHSLVYTGFVILISYETCQWQCVFWLLGLGHCSSILVVYNVIPLNIKIFTGICQLVLASDIQYDLYICKTSVDSKGANLPVLGVQI